MNDGRIGWFSLSNLGGSKNSAKGEDNAGQNLQAFWVD